MYLLCQPKQTIVPPLLPPPASITHRLLQCPEWLPHHEHMQQLNAHQTQTGQHLNRKVAPGLHAAQDSTAQQKLLLSIEYLDQRSVSVQNRCDNGSRLHRTLLGAYAAVSPPSLPVSALAASSHHTFTPLPPKPLNLGHPPPSCAHTHKCKCEYACTPAAPPPPKPPHAQPTSLCSSSVSSLSASVKASLAAFSTSGPAVNRLGSNFRAHARAVTWPITCWTLCGTAAAAAEQRKCQQMAH